MCNYLVVMQGWQQVILASSFSEVEAQVKYPDDIISITKLHGFTKDTILTITSG